MNENTYKNQNRNKKVDRWLCLDLSSDHLVSVIWHETGVKIK